MSESKEQLDELPLQPSDPSTSSKKDSKLAPTDSLENEKLKKPVIQEVSDQESHPSSFENGDLLWARLPGYPFWPALVTPDPCTKETTREKNGKLQVHLQYCNYNGSRSWLSASCVMLFNGLQLFEKLSKEKKTKSFIVPPRQKQSWLSAVGEAEALFESSNADRVETFFVMYPPPLMSKVKQASKEAEKVHLGKRKRSESTALVASELKKDEENSEDLTIDENNSTDCTQKKNNFEPPAVKRTKLKVEERTSLEQSENKPPAKKSLGMKKQKLKPLNEKEELQGFISFKSKHMHRLLHDNQDWSEEMAANCLKKRWDDMELAEKRNYLPIFYAFK